MDFKTLNLRMHRGFTFGAKRQMEAKGFTFMEAKGFTILELIISIAIIIFLTTALIVLVNAPEAKARTRDEKVLSDISKFDAEVSIYKLEHDVYPVLTPPLGVTYVHTNNSYEIDATLEYYLEKAQNDGGNNPAVYEIGNDLNLI